MIQRLNAAERHTYRLMRKFGIPAERCVGQLRQTKRLFEGISDEQEQAHRIKCKIIKQVTAKG
jgi:hypothetical protein